MIGAKTITDLGDVGITLPLVAGVAAWLAWRRHVRAALWSVLATIACFGGVATLKIVLFACSTSVLLRSPSGHAASSILVYGAIAVIAASALTGLARIAVFATAAALIVAVAATRVLLGAHSIIEVAAGLAVGLSALTGFAMPYLKRVPAEPQPWLLVAVAAAIMIVMHGRQIYVEDLLQLLGLRLRGAVPACA